MWFELKYVKNACYCLFFLLHTLPTSDCVAVVERSGIDNSYRLDGSVVPLSYFLEVKPYMLENEETNKHRFTFDGSVDITLSVRRENVSKIVLHSKDLFIQEMSLKTVSGESVSLHTYEYVREVDKLIIGLENPKEFLDVSMLYILTLKWSGVFSDDLRGFYKSSYFENGEEKYFAATQFQTTNARRAFPCFDEPDFRATFHIAVNCHQLIETVLSNTKLKMKVPQKNRVRYVFERTPNMPTYLVAILIADFSIRSDTKTVPTSIVARKQFYNQTQYSLDAADQILEKLDEFTGLRYADMEIGKLDLVALPDFSPNGMENWGLINFKEWRLFYDDSYTPLNTKQDILEILGHEIAHMWFGNYVTCKWWSYTWLNEGFARYLQYMIGQMVEPTWELEQQFVVNRLQTVLVVDSDQGAHSLTNPDVYSPNEISSMFGPITYDKGASIIRMLAHMLGPNHFQAAIKQYVKNKGSVQPSDLFKALSEEFSDTRVGNLNSIFRDFTEHAGYPLLQVHLSEDRKSFSIEQEPFHLRNVSTQHDIRWDIPITYTTNINSNFSSTTPELYFEKMNQKLTIEVQNVDWVILNIQQTGYYRVNYDDNNWNSLGKALKKRGYSGIPEVNRAQVVDDLLNLARAGRMSYSRVFELIAFVHRDDSFSTWKAVFNGLGYVASRISAKDEAMFKDFMQYFLHGIYNSLQFRHPKKDGHLTILNRINVLQWACKYGHKDCVVKAGKMLLGNTVHKDLRPIVLCTNVREGVSNIFNSVMKMYSEDSSPTEKLVILNSLACSKSKNELEILLNFILSNKVRLQDKANAIKSIYTSNTKGVDIVLDYILLNYRNVLNGFGKPATVATILLDLSNYFTSKNQLETLKNFYTTYRNNLHEMQEQFEKAFQKVEDNMEWDTQVLPNFLLAADSLRAKASGAVNLMTSVSLVTSVLLLVYLC